MWRTTGGEFSDGGRKSVDDYIGPDNPVRVLDAFVTQLDLVRLGSTHALTAPTGRPPCNPGNLLRLYLYGYLHKLRSS